MNDFISKAAKRFAQIIYANTAEYKILSTLKERFDKELSAYSNLSKTVFLDRLELELDVLFSDHLGRCPNELTCPQHPTFANANFLISEERKEERLSSFLINNDYYDLQITVYYDKLKTISKFLSKEKFINEEIERTKSKFLRPIENITISGGTIISFFDFSKYMQYAYEWLMSGQDWSLQHILTIARRECAGNNHPIGDENEFKTAIYLNLKKGVAFVLYEEFLNNELKKLSDITKASSFTATNLHIGDNYGQLHQGDTYKTKGSKKEKSTNLLYGIFANPWVITVIGGLLIAYLAKYFGWI